MSKLILDTNIYIDYLNQNKYQEIVFISAYPQRIFLSSIVLMELYAGAITHADVGLIDSIRKPFEKRRMIVAPTSHDYILAGKILAELQHMKGYELKKTFSLTNDVLIALCARRIGAILVTQNRKDFEAIKQIKDFRLEIV